MSHTLDVSKIIHYLDNNFFFRSNTTTFQALKGVGELSELWNYLLYTWMPQAPLILEESSVHSYVRKSPSVAWSQGNKMENCGLLFWDQNKVQPTTWLPGSTLRFQRCWYLPWHHTVSKCKIVLPDMLPRFYWPNAKFITGIEVMRKHINPTVKQFLKPSDTS